MDHQHKHNVNDDNDDQRRQRQCREQPKVDQFMDQLNDDHMVGRGAFGVVYKVQSKQSGKSYALKVVTLEPDDIDSMLYKEIDCLMNVSDNNKKCSQYVAKYYDHRIVSKDNQLFLLMDYSAGNLCQLLDAKPGICRRQSGDPLSKPEYYMTGAMFKLILEAVQHIHGLDPQIIHGDLKPDNIMIELNGFENSYAKLIDFGLATYHYRGGDNWQHNTAEDGGEQTKYMAPEMATGQQYDHRVDVYSLAIVGAELFAIDLHLLNANDVDQLRPGVFCRQRLNRIYYWLCRMHSPDPDDRPECSEIVADYDNWNFSMADIMFTWMANYNHIYQKLVPPTRPDQPNEQNILVRAGLDRHASLQQVIDMLAEEKWSKLLDAVFNENKYGDQIDLD
ncbi:cyclin-dependent kinase 20-like [Oppia nitens]|uniref:cyclin-dependent kinase 20-like n=1 Tax=Oppia nitens TaxID=1686743 RepID=UPI0023DAC44D|nr:cyclin-dependent kinase 20-like [Oppia nitens]